MGSSLSDGKQKSAEKMEFHPNYFATVFFLFLSLLCFTAMNIIYAENTTDFQTSNGSLFYVDCTLALLIVGSLFLVASVVSFLSIQKRKPTTLDSQSRVVKNLGTIIAETIFQNGKIIAAAASVYGVIFALLDGILIFQPSVNFATYYGVSSPSFIIENCCGPAGYIPVGLGYLPAEHLGLQLIPASVLILVLVSSLVGINVAFLNSAFRSSQQLRNIQTSGGSTPLVKTSFLSGALGATFGVFAGCPTCAAAFFLSMIAGSGATAFSITVSEFQPEIVLVSIPLLIGSIFWQASSVRKIFLGCQR